LRDNIPLSQQDADPHQQEQFAYQQALGIQAGHFDHTFPKSALASA
jgi:hypothetical protein